MNNICKPAGFDELLPIMAEQLKSGGTVKFKPYGTSMLPLLRHGKDEVLLEKADRKLKKYDIVFYKRADGQLVLHRLVKIKKNEYIFRGDHQFLYEHGITDENVIAIVKSVFRNGKEIKSGSLSFTLWAVFGAMFSRIYQRLYQLASKACKVFKRI